MNRNKCKRITRLAAGAFAALLLLFPSAVLADEGTDGTEMQVMQPEQLEIQLGAGWAGVEFQLKTDSGLYPGTIPVGEDGVLRLEIGGSSSYVLTCLNSETAAPDALEATAAAEEVDPETIQAEDMPQTGSQEEAQTVPEADAENPETGAEDATESGQAPAEEQEGTVAGIPVAHIALFAGGMVLAVGSLIVMHVLKSRRTMDADYEEDDEED